MPFFAMSVQDKGWDTAVKRWKDITSYGLEEDILDAAEETAQLLLRRIRRNAHKMGKDWGAAADRAWVERKEQTVVIMLPIESFVMEYGDEDTPPRPVVRNSIDQMGPGLSQQFNQALRIRLFGTGDI